MRMTICFRNINNLHSSILQKQNTNAKDINVTEKGYDFLKSGAISG